MIDYTKSHFAGKIKNLYLLVFLLFLTAEMFSQWVKTNGPYGGQIFSLVCCGNKLFANSFGKIYFSTNSGTSWTKINSEILDNIYVHSLFTSGINLFAGTYYESVGVYRSTDNGTSWTKSNAGLPNDINVCNFAVCDSYIFAGTWGKGIYRSSDNGANWIEVNSGLPTNSCISAFAVIGSNIFAGLVGDLGGVFLSTNNGYSWVPVNSGLKLKDNFIQSLVSVGTDVFAGTFSGGVFRSTNNGEGWTEINSGLTTTDIRSLAINSSESGETELYAGSWDGVFRSTNNGASWTSLNLALPVWTWVNCFAFTPNDSGGTNIFAGTFGTYGPGAGIFLSDNNGESWAPVNTGIPDTYIFSIGVNETDIFVSTCNGVFLSTDNGNNWSGCNLILPQKTLVNCFAFIPNGKETNIFAGTNGGIVLSTNNGTSWNPLNSALRNINCLAVSESNIFAGADGGIFLSTNNGASWTPVNSGLTNTSITSLAVNKSYIFAGTAGDIFRSNDNGTHWKPVYSDLTNIHCLTAFESNVFAGTNDGVFLSTNNGTNWINITSIFAEINFIIISSLAVCGSDLFVAAETMQGSVISGQGLWHRPFAEMITTVENPTELPKEFELYQNYPNPFNPTTVISFKIPAGTRSRQAGIFVQLKVYDVLGNEIATLVNEEKPAGNYEVKFDGSKYASGIYFYQLKTDNFLFTKKMLMIK